MFPGWKHSVYNWVSTSRETIKCIEEANEFFFLVGFSVRDEVVKNTCMCNLLIYFSAVGVEKQKEISTMLLG